MKSKLLNKIWLRSLAVVAVMTTAFAGQAWGADVTTTIGYMDIPDGFTATTGTSGTITKTIVSANDLTINYAGINTKSSATAANHAYGYAMFLKNYGYIYSSTAPSGYYPSKVRVTFGSNTGTSGKVGITYGNSALTTRNSSVNGTVTKGGTFELTNSDESLLYWNFSTTAANVQIDNIVVVYSSLQTNTNPLINADDVNIVYNATNGYISYSITNPVEGGQITAVKDADWLTLGEVGATIPFSCDANTTAVERSSTVTLTYTYNTNETVTKTIIVKQDANPNAVMTIAEAIAQGTGVSLKTKGVVTSCTGEHNFTAYIQDNTAAVCVYSSSALNVGDEIKVEGTLSNYNGLIEFNKPTVTVLTQNNTITPEVMTIAQVKASSKQGWLVRIENATATVISDDNTTIEQNGESIIVQGISEDVEYEQYDILSLTGNIGCKNNVVQIANPTNVIVAPPAVAAPEFSIAAGTYPGAQTVSITCSTEGATIYYTTEKDATGAPTNWQQYSTSISITTTTTLFAKAESGTDVSRIVSVNYTIVNVTDGLFDFASKFYDYGSGVTTTTSSNYYITEAKTWVAGNVTLVTSGKYRWWDRDGTLRFAANDPASAMTISVPSDKLITSIVVTGANGFQSDCGTFTNGTWTGTSQTVTLAMNATSSQNVSRVTVTYVDAATITLASACTDGTNYYGTYSNSSAFVVPEDLTVSEIGVKDNGDLDVQNYATGAIVPANTGVMISSAAAGAHYVILSSENGTSVLGNNNRLRPSGAGITAAQMAAAAPSCKYYRLTMHNGTELGFYWGAPEGAAFDLAANKAYLALQQRSSGQSFIGINPGEESGIEAVFTTNDDSNVYDLQGRRVAQPQKGLYIVNGKKVIIK